MSFDPGPLLGKRVRLEPLALHHVGALANAAAQDRSSYGYANVPAGPPAMHEYVLNLLKAGAAGETVPFAQLRADDGRAVGTTRLLALRRRPDDGKPFAVEIGGTWLAASAQRSGINTEAKLLLMTHAFDALGVDRVDIKTDARNARARQAIAALGATFEGVLRRWQPSQVPGEGELLRDTAMYSVVRPEWPEVRQGLQARLAV